MDLNAFRRLLVTFCDWLGRGLHWNGAIQIQSKGLQLSILSIYMTCIHQKGSESGTHGFVQKRSPDTGIHAAADSSNAILVSQPCQLQSSCFGFKPISMGRAKTP
eukprot:6489232-Amphidinium_carterae.1